MKTEGIIRIAKFFIYSIFLAVSGGCIGGNSVPPAPGPTPAGEDRDGKPGVGPLGGRPVSKLVYLAQNWTPEESLRFYYTSQGSQIVPYDWFLALERAGDGSMLRDDESMLELGYLLQKPDWWNPDGLPVGFVKDDTEPIAWLGLTCAACHTSQLDYDGIGYRIDGGPALADVRGFLVALVDALKATRDQEPRFARFAAKILGSKDSPGERDALKTELSLTIDRREEYNARNFPADALPGYARVDAFGAIMNEVFHQAARLPAGPSPSFNTERADAPVSYPCLWDTPQHDVVQWNGVAKNAGLGSLGRNVGEVLGVFGRLEIPENPDVTGYASTIRVRNLLAIEESLKRLWSPLWPAGLPEINPADRDAGKLVFEKYKCGECHRPIDRTDRFRRVEAQMRAVGTEPRMMENFSNRRGKTGKLEGAYQRVIPWPPLSPQKLGPEASAEELLGHAVIGTILASGYPAPKDELTDIEYRRRNAAMAPAAFPLAPMGGIYKARPLNGLWATAPYLHNGSVPNLDALLRPAKDRPKTFTVGSREFDPVKVGFRTDAPGFPLFRAREDDGRPVPGNSNEGHEPPAGLTDREREQLIAYLKSL